MRLHSLSAVVLFLLLSRSLLAQNGATGTWKTHLPYKGATALAIDNNKVYVGGPSGIFTYSLFDRSVESLGKNNGLSKLSVSTLKYHDSLAMLMVVYDDCDIDLIRNGFIYNVEDIARKQVLGVKRINHISFYRQFAYLSGTLGLIVVDLARQEIRDSYTNIGADGEPVEVFTSTVFHDSVYACTSKGILRASLNSPNLADYRYWSTFTTTEGSRLCATYNNKLYLELDSVIEVWDGLTWSAFRDNTKRRNYSIQITSGNLIISQQDATSVLWKNGNTYFPFTMEPVDALTSNDGLIFYLQFTKTGLNFLNSTTGTPTNGIFPNGPDGNTAAAIAVNGTDMWVAGGNARNWTLSYNFNKFYRYFNGKWTSAADFNPTGLDTVSDIVSIAVHPSTGNVFMGSFGRGLYELNPGTGIATAYNETNSSLRRPPNDPNRPLNISGLKFDRNNNLWATNYGAVSPLSVYTTDGQWISYNFGSTLNTQYPLTDIEIDDQGRKWLVAVRSNGLLVFDDNGTLADKTDDRYRLLRQGGGSGNLPSSDVTCVAKDRDGEIWIGTQAGLAVLFNPSEVFEGADAQQIIIGSGTDAAYLMGTEFINCITVDGGNRKWIGTRNGAWLVAADGNQILKYYTTQNSNLISNNVLQIAINPVSGEVVMITDKGLISFFGDATEGGATHGNVFVFPNPVRPDFEGEISIRGLPEKANVKITDINGFLVYETQSNGGMATWNGRNFSGQKASTGVYLIFSSNPDGSDSMVSKILFIR